MKIGKKSNFTTSCIGFLGGAVQPSSAISGFTRRPEVPKRLVIGGERGRQVDLCENLESRIKNPRLCCIFFGAADVFLS